MYKDKKIGVVVPAYNEENFITKVIDHVPGFVDRIYVVNDGSTDKTKEVVESVKNVRLALINHDVNKGVGAAIVTGYKKCLADEMDISVVMAGDDQMDPVQLENILAPIIEGKAGYAKGNRMSSMKHLQGMSPWRRFGNWLLRWLTRISSGNYKIMDPQNGYAAISKEALKKIDLDKVYPYYGYCNDLLVKFTVARVNVVEVSMPARYQGEKSKIRYGKYIFKVSSLLLSGFLWRMKMKYMTYETKFKLRVNKNG